MHESRIFVVSLRRVFISCHQRNVIVLCFDKAITPGSIPTLNFFTGTAWPAGKKQRPPERQRMKDDGAIWCHCNRLCVGPWAEVYFCNIAVMYRIILYRRFGINHSL